MVGEWAERTLPAQGDGFLSSFSQVLDEENPELFKWLTGQELPPPRMAANVAFTSLQSHVLKFLNDKSDSATRAARGREWVRGWNDSRGETSDKKNQVEAELRRECSTDEILA